MYICLYNSCNVLYKVLVVYTQAKHFDSRELSSIIKESENFNSLRIMYCNTRDNKQICFCVITFNKTKKSHIILDCTVTSQNENMIKCFSSMICAQDWSTMRLMTAKPAFMDEGTRTATGSFTLYTRFIFVVYFSSSWK